MAVSYAPRGILGFPQRLLPEVVDGGVGQGRAMPAASSGRRGPRTRRGYFFGLAGWGRWRTHRASSPPGRNEVGRFPGFQVKQR